MGKRSPKPTRNDRRRSARRRATKPRSATSAGTAGGRRQARADAARAIEQHVLPPTPQQLQVPPDPNMTAADGTGTVPAITDLPGAGWAVVDEQGRIVELLIFLRDELTAAEHRILDGFERGRAMLEDPRFADYDPGLRERLARRAPEGKPKYLSLQYSHYPDSARDGTRSVVVSAFEELDAWLVLDADGCLADGVRFPFAKQAGALAGDRFRAFLERRLLASDPGLSAFNDRPFGPGLSGYRRELS